MSIWVREKLILKKVWFEEFMPYPHFIVYDIEATLAPFNGYSTDYLIYLSRHTPVTVAAHDILGCEPVSLVNENSECLIERFHSSLDRKARSNSCRCFKAIPISFRFFKCFQGR